MKKKELEVIIAERRAKDLRIIMRAIEAAHRTYPVASAERK